MDRFEAFWAAAKQLSLASEQKERIRHHLTHHIEEAAQPGRSLGEAGRSPVRNLTLDCPEDQMESQHDQLWAAATKGPLLAPERKDAIRENLRMYAEQSLKNDQVWKEKPLPLGTRIALRWKLLSSSLIASLSLGGMSVAYAAESAVPGDALYSVKTSVNEPVMGVFAISPEAKVAWQVTLAERRLKEEEILLARGVSQETIDAIHATVDARLQQAGERLQEWAAEHPEEAFVLQERLSTMLETHGSLREAIRSRFEETLGTEGASSSSDTTVQPLWQQWWKNRR